VAWLTGGHTTLGFDQNPAEPHPPARWGEFSGISKRQTYSDIDVSSLMGMALDVVEKKAEDRAKSERAGAGRPGRVVLPGETMQGNPSPLPSASNL
jgi:hypothetical protein